MPAGLPLNYLYHNSEEQFQLQEKPDLSASDSCMQIQGVHLSLQ